MLERYSYSNGKKLRCGYTTGTCATAAAKASVTALLTGSMPDEVSVILPDNTKLSVPVTDGFFDENMARCAVKKDGGDDIDVTNGILVYAVVRRTVSGISVDGGAGIGRVTKKGLDQPVGAAAINSTPRRMIIDAVTDVCDKLCYEGGIEVIIEVPEGAVIAEKTFNPRLGIEGGISILGTSGIVEPMSEQALIDTIRVEINIKREEGCRYLLITPGNYGLDYVRGNTLLNASRAVKCSNFIGNTLDMAKEAGFEKILLIGHIGKLVKLSLGIMNTHSSCADGRMEALAACCIEAETSYDILLKVITCNTTDEAVELLKENRCLDDVMDRLMKKIEKVMNNRVGDDIQCAAVVFSNVHGMLGMTSHAEEMLKISEGF